LKQNLATLIAIAEKQKQTNITFNVSMTPEVEARYKAIDKTYGTLAYSDSSKPYLLAYNRVTLVTMKTAALLAVGVNPYNPVITMVEMAWAEKFANNSAQTIIKRFESGTVGEPNAYIEQHDQLMRCLKIYLTKEWTPKFEKNYGITETFKANNIITYKYIKTMLHRQPAFRNAQNPKMAFENVLALFEKQSTY
jgi:hypothetical protein